MNTNRASYNSIAADWDRARASFFGRERDYVDAFLDGYPKSSAILDLGCGTGRPIAEYVLAHGHHITGIDQASALLAQARRRFPQATWIEASLEDVELVEPYAGIVCWDVLFHIRRSAHAGLLSKMAGNLQPGGKVMITVGGSDHPPFTDSMFGHEFFYDSNTPEETLSILNELGFETVVAEFINQPTSGRDKGRYAIIARLR